MVSETILDNQFAKTTMILQRCQSICKRRQFRTTWAISGKRMVFPLNEYGKDWGMTIILQKVTINLKLTVLWFMVSQTKNENALSWNRVPMPLPHQTEKWLSRYFSARSFLCGPWCPKPKTNWTFSKRGALFSASRQMIPFSLFLSFPLLIYFDIF